MTVSCDVPLPIDEWSREMKIAIEEICQVGARFLTEHQQASPQAAEIAEQWQLSARLEQERLALETLLAQIRSVIESIENVRREIHQRRVDAEPALDAMQACAGLIHESLPRIEQALLTVRHSALDLLLWAQRWGKLEDSELPDQYRACYAKLISYTPVLKPRFEAMQQDLLRMDCQQTALPRVHAFVSALTRYNVVADSARGFVRSVVEPPLELVFHDSEDFLVDWQTYSVEQRGELATQLNDTCQFLLYDPSAFRTRVDNIQPKLQSGIDASLYLLAIGDERILFTVDEDPVFQQLVVTLLRVVPAAQLEKASGQVVAALYRDLTEDE